MALSAWVNQVHFGDCLATLGRMPDGIVNTCVTSPPYYGLRNYGVPSTAWPAMTYRTLGGEVSVPAMTCCLGLEPTPEAFIGHMVLIFREARRVLRDDGTCWLNMGDSYAGSGRGGNSEAITGRGKDASKITGGTAREAAVTQRGRRLPAGLHGEQVESGALGRAWVPPPPGLKQKDLIGVPWMLAFALRFDGWYLRQGVIWNKPNPMPESVTDRCTKAHEDIFLLAKSPRYYFDQGAIAEEVAPSTVERLSQPTLEEQRGSHRVPGKTNGTMKAVGRKQLPEGQDRLAGFRDEQRAQSRRNSFARTTKDSAGEHGQKPQFREDRDPVVYEGRRNKRSVWTVSTKPYSGAHFATFPPDLIEPCILAGAPAGGVVLDPFMGSGTTAMVATRLGRQWIGCELNPGYESLQHDRLTGLTPGLELV